MGIFVLFFHGIVHPKKITSPKSNQFQLQSRLSSYMNKFHKKFVDERKANIGRNTAANVSIYVYSRDYI